MQYRKSARERPAARPFGGLAPRGCSATQMVRKALFGAMAAAAFWAPAWADPLPLRGIALQDHRGHVYKADAVPRGPVLLHFIYTGCSATCPTQVRELVELRAQLPAALRRQVRFFSISLDPLADTPATLAAFARKAGAEQPGWQFLTGARGPVDGLIERMRLFDPAKPGVADHRTALYLYGSDGQLVQRFRGVPVDIPRLGDELARLVHFEASAAAKPARAALLPASAPF
jgi:cytochrome oxidase Cu insertion factor (SCO1/SenC/PrrC family)